MISLLSCRYKFIYFLFATHAVEHYRPILSTIRSHRIMREEGATKRDGGDARAGQSSRRFDVIFILHSCSIRQRHLSCRRFHRLNHGCVRDARRNGSWKTDLRSTNSTNDNPCITCKFAYRVPLLVLV